MKKYLFLIMFIVGCQRGTRVSPNSPEVQVSACVEVSSTVAMLATKKSKLRREEYLAEVITILEKDATRCSPTEAVTVLDLNWNLECDSYCTIKEK